MAEKKILQELNDVQSQVRAWLDKMHQQSRLHSQTVVEHPTDFNAEEWI